MAAPEVTYEDMTKAFGMAVSRESFGSLLPHAEALVRDLTWPNEPEGELQAGAWVRAVCSAVLADSETGGTHGAGDGGFTIGKFSVSGGSGGSDAAGAIRAAARRQLVGTGLLARVVGGV
ncbi:hypothetical protein [uncultured Parolsenella sp.]|uniref:hypothetical protein n=1 Tax=uncultured Parolsenella sp. TaxID=2083008 RepID=UPI0027D98581|nr:hypothetical protein [uncultured Parolsenella sp.]